MIIRKSPAEIDRIAAAGAIVAETITHVGERIEPGITTLELDRIAEDFIRGQGGIPTSQGYRGYPRAICISVNAPRRAITLAASSCCGFQVIVRLSAETFTRNNTIIWKGQCNEKNTKNQSPAGSERLRRGESAVR